MIKRLFVILSIIFIASPMSVFAVNDVSLNGIVTFQLDTIDAVPFTITILGQNAGQVTNLDVQSNYIDVTLDNASTITFNTTAPNEYFTITRQGGSFDYNIVPGCVTTQATLNGTGATVVLRIQVSTTLPGCATPRSGGGETFPTNYSVGINNGDATTTSQNVILNLQATNASQVLISNNENFVGAEWESFTNPMEKAWVLESGYGLKTVYVLYKGSTGNTGVPISDSIELIEAPVTPPEEPSEEPEVPTPTPGRIDYSQITYDLYIINPDGSTRSMTNGYAVTEDLENGIVNINFEDSGADFDYNDMKIQIDSSDPENIKITVVSLDAGWHHQIKIKLFYEGIFQDDILLWPDSHEAIGETTIVNVNDYIQVGEEITLLEGDLIKGSPAAVYYYSQDNKRHPFPNEKVYFSWYTDFSQVKSISNSQLASIQLGSNMTYKPGSRMLKLQTDPKVYAVDEGAILRWVTTEQVAADLYGQNWATYIDDISDAFFVNYTIGDPIYTAGDYTIDLSFLNIAVIPLSTPPVSSVAQCSCNIEFTQSLSLGSEGDEVVVLQDLLKCLGYFPSEVDSTGYYGSITEQGVKDFQSDNGIDSIGSVGQKTREALNKYYNP